MEMACRPQDAHVHVTFPEAKSMVQDFPTCGDGGYSDSHASWETVIHRPIGLPGIICTSAMTPASTATAGPTSLPRISSRPCAHRRTELLCRCLAKGCYVEWSCNGCAWGPMRNSDRGIHRGGGGSVGSPEGSGRNVLPQPLFRINLK